MYGCIGGCVYMSVCEGMNSAHVVWAFVYNIL